MAQRTARIVWGITLAELASGLVFEWRLWVIGRDDLSIFRHPEYVAYLVATLSAASVGLALATHRPHHPVGWLFLALGATIGLAGVADGYARYGAVAHPGALPVANYVAAYSSSAWVPWMPLVALIMLLTPTGRPPSRRWTWIGWAAGISACIVLPTTLLRPGLLEPPLGNVMNPIGVTAIEGPLAFADLVALTVMMFTIPAAAVSLLFRFHRATGEARQQLRWVALAAVPLPILAAGTWVTSAADQEFALTLLAGGYLAILPVTVGLAISQYHLYEVDRVFSRALTYSLLTGVVVGVYAVTVLAIGGAGGGSALTVAGATLAAVSVAGPARRWLQDRIDRRFNRRRFDAIALLQRYVRDPDTASSIQEVLAQALGESEVRVLYWIEDRSVWVDALGEASICDPRGVEVTRRGRPVAWVSADASSIDNGLLLAVANEARTELENERLRAAIQLQLVEVRESRTRIVEAQMGERKRLERNLHDGAQQRLLALAMEMRAAQVSGNAERARATLERAVGEIQVAVRELRDLANGLHPALLADGGLAAAFEDLAARAPIPIRVQATDHRFSPAVEEAAWFIACEAVTNAVKHGLPSQVDITTVHEGNRLLLTVADDGIGGADPAGQGLRGVADRASAAGGRLTVQERPGRGTMVMADLPCAS